MAKVTRVQIVDDLDGTVLEDGEGQTLEFALDGQAYTIDLKPEHAQQLRDALGPWVAHATRVSSSRRASSNGSSRRSSSTRSASGMTPEELNEVREWARSNGYQVADRGRIKASVLEAFEAAH
ncbi:Lsr2 family protein [Aeromicrobium sp. IC_218]|uniref:histone-like nucleoid-structuring protein Lsr2 n=1 Tax=Aeromicrobium sp. IC_218 TaxID=2545468 RepID=UPI00103C1E11|nr:Lsr2 family protein [Aeromicrobium sp. IC_218]TCI97480.1 Lsr2 family protein [Aeromicrobium sp. IC_218]